MPIGMIDLQQTQWYTKFLSTKNHSSISRISSVYKTLAYLYNSWKLYIIYLLLDIDLLLIAWYYHQRLNNVVRLKHI